MKLVVFRNQGKSYIGIVTEEGVLPTQILADSFYEGGFKALEILRAQNINSAYLVNEDDLTLDPVVPNPGKILCVGLNYRQHAHEFGQEEPQYPILFSKFSNTIAAHQEPVPLAPEWTHVDYEAELGIVMGQTAWRVSEDNALSYVMGYFCANDISERDLQKRSGQWLLGKTMNKFLPIGPYMVTADEIPDPQSLAIRGWLNGELRQNSTTADMIFSVAQIISYASHFFPLTPGDIILSGTPEGVIVGREDQQYMKPGDKYRVSIDGLGTLENQMTEIVVES